MDELDKAADSVIDRVKQKMARDALNGAIGLIYATHELSVAKDIIRSAVDDAVNY